MFVLCWLNLAYYKKYQIETLLKREICLAYGFREISVHHGKEGVKVKMTLCLEVEA